MKTSSFRVSRGWFQGGGGQGSYGRLLRRLHVESMEDRVMLSATELNFDWFSENAAQFSFQMADQLIVANRVDGGYITFDMSIAGSEIKQDSDAVQFSGFGTFGEPGTVLSPTELRDMISSSARSYVDSNVTLHLDNGDIRVIEFASTVSPTFDPADSSPEGLSAEPSLYTSPTEAVIPTPLESVSDGNNDGGSIPISTILASVGSLENLRASQQGRELANRSEVDASNPVEKLVDSSTSQDEIAAEWARAVAFEYAGGEPTGNSQNDGATVQDDTNATILLDNELSSTEQPGAEAQGVAPDAIPTASAAEQITPLSLGQLPIPLNGDTIGFTALPAMGVSLVDTQGADTSYLQAFDELGDGEQSRGYWWTDYAKQAANASPVLLMLALERIAARNSRRAGKEAGRPRPNLAGRES